MVDDKKVRGPSTHNKSKGDLAKTVSNVLIEEIFEYWKVAMGKTKRRAALDVNRHRDIGWAIAVYGVDACREAIDGCANDPWWMGANNRGIAYNDVSVIFRNAGNVEKFLELHDKQSESSAKEEWINE